MAIGSDWSGAPNEQTPFPAAFEVDYVRVYQRTQQRPCIQPASEQSSQP